MAKTNYDKLKNNSETNDELIDKIHEEYEAITQTADKERKDYLINKYENMNKYEMKDLDLSALSKEDFEFLDKKYDLQHNYWAMAQRHKDVREEFVKAVENGDYEIIDLPNKQQALRVMGLSDENGTKSYHGVMDIEYGEIGNYATIDIYDGINTNPVYSMSISFGDLDRLNAVLRNDHFDICEYSSREEARDCLDQLYGEGFLSEEAYEGYIIEIDESDYWDDKVK